MSNSNYEYSAFEILIKDGSGQCASRSSVIIKDEHK